MKKSGVWIAVSALLISAGATANETAPVDVHWSIESGIGFDTNAFHAPDHDYADYYADPTGATIVQPDEKAGIFIPLKVKTEATQPIDEYSSLNVQYRFNGYYYPDSAVNDASSTDHEVNIGADFNLGKKGKQGKAYAGVFVRSHDKVYVDRDSGDPKTSVAGVDVSNRYTYTSFGVEGDYERKLSYQNSVGVKGVVESLDYEDPVAWKQYDHSYLMLGTYIEHRLQKNTKLSAGISTERRNYTERRAYSANGTLVNTNPLLSYSYLIYELGVRHRFDDNTVAYFDYELLQRRDNHVGYNDMDQNTVKVRVIHDLNKKMRLRGKIRLYDRNYANAFNFEDPAQGGKSASAVDWELRGEYYRNQHKTYYTELNHNSHDNSDDRYQYVNTTVTLGAVWEF